MKYTKLPGLVIFGALYVMPEHIEMQVFYASERIYDCWMHHHYNAPSSAV